MNLKKSIFSYIVLAVFALVCCLCIFFVLERAGITAVLGWPMYATAGGVCVYLLLTAAVFIALRTICMEIGRHIRDPKKLERVCAVVLPAAVLLGIAAYLVIYLLYHTPVTLENDSFYRLALVSDKAGVSFAVHGTSWLYTCLLHVMLLFFGNTPFAGVVLQIVLFFVCLMLLYIGMQSFAGTLPAAVSLALIGFLPVSLRYVFSLTPDLFYLMFYLLGFALTGTAYRRFRGRKESSPAWYVLLFLLGLYIGFLSYLDLYGVFVYLFLTLLLSVDWERTGQAVMLNLSALLGGVFGFSASVITVSLMEGIQVSDYLQKLFSLYFSEAEFTQELSRFISYLPDSTAAGSILLISLAFFMIPAFFIWKRSQCSAFLVNLLLLYILSGFSIFYLDMQMIVTTVWSMLAGMAVYSVIRRQDESAAEEAEASEKNGEEAEQKEKKTKKKKQKASKKEEGSGAVSAEIQKKEQEKPAPGEPLHNPLPVPKKKKRPAADFGYQITEAEMKFDLDVKDNDDFDW